ncbi:UBC-like protein [Clathrospora elynae]|uniref:UBC-like protein n=1 Tax=Clathrospora elynae TaxID=706981 RepID=A0A6A5S6K5_9PLEO|nr:UBC-like protein [Clathrospora elynae]
MNSKSLRRLAADHGSLHTAGLPPNYLFPSSSSDSSDLTSLDILLAGPVGTPYASGVWRLHLDIPPTYPTAPPTAQFRTRLWHPNIDEATGVVCVETLKRDWSSTLKLRDVLVTISCLLIQPNPASALNEAAGKLAVEDWDGYCRRAKLMTDIHAAVPNNMVKEVKDAQMRGEDKPTESEHPIAKPHSKGKEKERVRITPSGPKLRRPADEDEENRRRRGQTQEPESDPESDWIPGPAKTTKAAPARQENSIFGIKGLEDIMQLDTPPKRIFAVDAVPLPTTSNEKENKDDVDPFITVASKRTHANSSFDLRLPLPPASTVPTSSTLIQPSTTDTPELLKFSHQNPFSAIQLNNQSHPLFNEFSYSWEDAAVLHGTVNGDHGEESMDTRKRVVDEAFETRKKWEMKRFRMAGCELGRWNRGDFGAREGVGRL